MKNTSKMLFWLPEQLSENIIVMKSSGAKYSLRGSDNIVIPRFQSRYLERSVTYRGAVLWEYNYVLECRHCSCTRKSIDSRLSKIVEFKDFHFKVTSTSTVNFCDQDYFYF